MHVCVVGLSRSSLEDGSARFLSYTAMVRQRETLDIIYILYRVRFLDGKEDTERTNKESPHSSSSHQVRSCAVEPTSKFIPTPAGRVKHCNFGVKATRSLSDG